MDNVLLTTPLGGLPAFDAITPEAVEPAVESILAANNRRLEELLAGAAKHAPDFKSLILPLEEMGERLHRVWSPVGHLHAVANTPQLRAAYNRCLPLLSRYFTQLSQNETLFNHCRSVAATLPAQRDEAGRMLVRNLLRDFQLAGVGLPQEKKSRFMEVMEELSALQARFEQNLLDSMAAWSHLETDVERLKGLSSQVLERAADAAAQAALKGWLFKLDQPTYTAVMTDGECEDLRALVHRQWATRASDIGPGGAAFDNTSTMQGILTLRHEAARLVGFPHYADYSLATKMAHSVAEVQAFLERLRVASQSRARAEFAALEAFAGRRLNPWDVAFYSEKLRRHEFSLSDEELRPYFPLPKVLNGLFTLIGELYGIGFRADPQVRTWHPDVSYYHLLDAQGSAMGGLFLDPYARADKRSGAWMDNCVSRSRIAGEVQKPVAHLVCNFAPPGRDAPSLLSHDEVLTLFHEAGHGLHHLLTRVDYPSVSGIQGVPWDAVELPSQFMEGFAWQPQILATISGHYKTGEPLPAVLLKKLRASRIFQGAMHMVRQLEFAIFDLSLHAADPPSSGQSIAAIMEEVRQRVCVVPRASYDRFAHGFGHIFGGGYAAGYYSYKWAEVLSADAFAAFEESGIRNPALAESFRRNILEVGGSRPIDEAFRAFRGRDPDVGALLRESGIAPATVQE